MDINQTQGGDHFAIYTYTKSCCTPKTNAMLYINYSLIKMYFNKNSYSCRDPILLGVCVLLLYPSPITYQYFFSHTLDFFPFQGHSLLIQVSKAEISKPRFATPYKKMLAYSPRVSNSFKLNFKTCVFCLKNGGQTGFQC